MINIIGNTYSVPTNRSHLHYQCKEKGSRKRVQRKISFLG